MDKKEKFIDEIVKLKNNNFLNKYDFYISICFGLMGGIMLAMPIFTEFFFGSSWNNKNVVFCIGMIILIFLGFFGIFAFLKNKKNKSIQNYHRKIKDFYNEGIAITILKECKEFLESDSQKKNVNEQVFEDFNNLLYRYSQHKISIDDINWLLYIYQKKEKYVKEIELNKSKMEAIEKVNAQILNSDNNMELDDSSIREKKLLFFNTR